MVLFEYHFYPNDQPPFPRPPVRPHGWSRSLPPKANSCYPLIDHEKYDWVELAAIYAQRWDMPVLTAQPLALDIVPVAEALQISQQPVAPGSVQAAWLGTSCHVTWLEETATVGTYQVREALIGAGRRLGGLFGAKDLVGRRIRLLHEESAEDSAHFELCGIDLFPIETEQSPVLLFLEQHEGFVVEAIESKGDHFVLGVQWHPEKLDGEARLALFRALVAACQER